jgi:hypothetical protein
MKQAPLMSEGTPAVLCCACAAGAKVKASSTSNSTAAVARPFIAALISATLMAAL